VTADESLQQTAEGDTSGDAPAADADADPSLNKADHRLAKPVPGAEVIQAVENAVGCRVIVYHSTSASLETWDLRPLHSLLEAMGKQNRAALIIQSPGGSADAAHALSSLLNDYIRELHIYVVSYAASAATILALAANKLWMGPGSELSPVDPQVPIDPRMLVPTAASKQTEEATPAGEPIHIPAHVIRDFLELTGVMDAADGAYPRQKIHPERLEGLFEPLNPWILGWYERADKVSRLYTRDALVNHLLHVQRSDLSPAERGKLADEITHSLLDHYASHETGIQRTEARRIGIPVTDCPPHVWAKLQQQRDWYDEVIQRQNVGRILETRDGVHVVPARPERECPHCQEVHEVQGFIKGFKYCPSCGSAFERQCKQCGRSLRPGWGFCPECGAAASESPEHNAGDADVQTAQTVEHQP
jgi:hypothetical protein